MAKVNNYAEKLQDINWQKKRLELFELRGWKCEKCGVSEKTQLHCHHRFYINGREPWEYDNDVFQVLCNECHQKEHDEIGVFKKLEYNTELKDYNKYIYTTEQFMRAEESEILKESRLSQIAKTIIKVFINKSFIENYNGFVFIENSTLYAYEEFIKKYGYHAFYEDMIERFLKIDFNQEIYWSIYKENEYFIDNISKNLKIIFKDSNFTEQSIGAAARWMFFKSDYISNGRLDNILIKEYIQGFNRQKSS
jgi:hypothetical protein